MLKKINILLISFLVLGICACQIDTNQPSPPKIWRGLRPGPYSVGFKVSNNFIDSTQHTNLSIHGSLQIGFWYPIEENSQTKMTIRDYIDLKAWDRMDIPKNKTTIDTSFSGFRIEALNKGVDPEKFDELTKLKTAAYIDAPQKTEIFPLIIIASGRSGSLMEHFILAEYMASHGFIVGSAPSIVRISPNPKHVITEYLDVMEIVLEKAENEYKIDKSKVGLIGYSLCGTCITLFHEKVRPVQALLSLDGWDGWDSGAKYLTDNLDMSLSEIGIPFAYLAEDPAIVKKYDESPTALDHSAVTNLASTKGFLTYFKDLRHWDFTSAAFLEFEAPRYSFSNWQKEMLVNNSRPMELAHEFVELYMSGFLEEDHDALEQLCESLSASEANGILIETPVQVLCKDF